MGQFMTVAVTDYCYNVELYLMQEIELFDVGTCGGT